MRAVLIATGYSPDMENLISYRPTPLLRIADKPIIYYILEFLVQQKIKQCDIILSHLPQTIEKNLGTGERWGISITYHLVRAPEQPFSILRPVSQGWDNEPVLLGMGDTLPKFNKNYLKPTEPNKPLLFYYPDKVWSGWGIFPSKVLGAIPSKASIDDIPNQLPVDFVIAPARETLSTRNFEDLKKANFKMISNIHNYYLLPPTSKMIEPSVWISRAVSLHPTAQIFPPVFIGRNCQIKRGSIIGPNAIVENNCIIDNRTVIQDTIICQRSYVGEGLEIHNSIVDRNLLINLSLKTNIEVKDDFILSELSAPRLKNYPGMLLERLFAGLAFLVLFPIYIYMKQKNPLERNTRLRLPAPSDPHNWTTFDWLTFDLDGRKKKITALQKFFERLPALLNIMKGEAHFVGVAPRSITEVENLPPDWRKLYLNSKVGLITLSDLDNGPNATIDDLYASEVYYSIHMGFLFDVKLLFRRLLKKITGLKGTMSSAAGQALEDQKIQSDAQNSH